MSEATTGLDQAQLQAAGWWYAADGNWYRPEQHPDPNHRAHFAALAQASTPPAPSSSSSQPPPPNAASTRTDRGSATAPAMAAEPAAEEGAAEPEKLFDPNALHEYSQQAIRGEKEEAWRDIDWRKQRGESGEPDVIASRKSRGRVGALVSFVAFLFLSAAALNFVPKLWDEAKEPIREAREVATEAAVDAALEQTEGMDPFGVEEARENAQGATFDPETFGNQYKNGFGSMPEAADSRGIGGGLTVTDGKVSLPVMPTPSGGSSVGDTSTRPPIPVVPAPGGTAPVSHYLWKFVPPELANRETVQQAVDAACSELGSGIPAEIAASGALAELEATGDATTAHALAGTFEYAADQACPDHAGRFGPIADRAYTLAMTMAGTPGTVSFTETDLRAATDPNLAVRFQEAMVAEDPTLVRLDQDRVTLYAMTGRVITSCIAAREGISAAEWATVMTVEIRASNPTNWSSHLRALDVGGEIYCPSHSIMLADTAAAVRSIDPGLAG